MQSARRSSPRPTSLATPWLPLPRPSPRPGEGGQPLGLASNSAGSSTSSPTAPTCRPGSTSPPLVHAAARCSGSSGPRSNSTTPGSSAGSTGCRSIPSGSVESSSASRTPTTRPTPDEALPRLKLHGLRHTWATLALEEGIDIHVVSDRLDHSSTHITSEIYTQVRRPLQSDAADRVAARIFQTA